MEKQQEHEELISFLNSVFGEQEDFPGFVKLLPKLYKIEKEPCKYNYLARKAGKIVAAVGVYDGILNVGESKLNYRGIGNVAVKKEERGNGLMSSLLKEALKDMYRDGIHFAVLGGQRQRYGYFGFDSVGVEYRATINRTNLQHVYRYEAHKSLEIKDFDANHLDILEDVCALHKSRKIHTEREKKDFADIFNSWEEKAKVILKDGECVGYYIGNIQELTLKDMRDFPDVMRTCLQDVDEVELVIPSWDYELLDAVSLLYEDLDVGVCDMFHILDYCQVIKVLLEWKALQEELAEGQITLLIHGYEKDVKLKISVKDKVVLVEECEEKEEIELTHQEAMQMFFGLYSKKRKKMKPEIRSWFPLPIHIEHADEV